MLLFSNRLTCEMRAGLCQLFSIQIVEYASEAGRRLLRAPYNLS